MLQALLCRAYSKTISGDQPLTRVERTQHQDTQTQALIQAFGRLAPYKDDETVKRAYEAENQKTLLIETDLSAWNNIRMSWEETVCYAYRSHRIYRVPTIPQDSTSDQRVVFNRPLNLFSYYDERSFKMVIPSMLDTDKTPTSDVTYPTGANIFQKEPKEYSEFNLVYKGGKDHLDLRAFGSYSSDSHLVPHQEYVSLIESAFRVRWELLQLAMSRLSANGLAPGQYVAIHRRRGDMDGIFKQFHPEVLDNSNVAKYLAPEIEGKQVLVVTDTYDAEFLKELKEVAHAARVVCWANETQTGDDQVFGAQIDMLSAVAAKTFIGTPGSTFSLGIIRWRVQSGWHKTGDPLKFLVPTAVSNEGWDSPGASGTYIRHHDKHRVYPGASGTYFAELSWDAEWAKLYFPHVHRSGEAKW